MNLIPLNNAFNIRNIIFLRSVLEMDFQLEKTQKSQKLNKKQIANILTMKLSIYVIGKNYINNTVNIKGDF